MPKRLRWSKAGLGEWHGYEVNNTGAPGTEVAVAVKTGTYLDHYPWDWYFTTYGVTLVPSTTLPGNHKRHHAGVADTLRQAKSEVEMNLASAGDA